MPHLSWVAQVVACRERLAGKLPDLWISPNLITDFFFYLETGKAVLITSPQPCVSDDPSGAFLTFPADDRVSPLHSPSASSADEEQDDDFEEFDEDDFDDEFDDDFEEEFEDEYEADDDDGFADLPDDFTGEVPKPDKTDKTDSKD